MPGFSGPGGGNVGALIISPFTKPGTTNATPYNHYALLCSIENVFGLGHLGFAGAPGPHVLRQGRLRRDPSDLAVLSIRGHHGKCPVDLLAGRKTQPAR